MINQKLVQQDLSRKGRVRFSEDKWGRTPERLKAGKLFSEVNQKVLDAWHEAKSLPAKIKQLGDIGPNGFRDLEQALDYLHKAGNIYQNWTNTMWSHGKVSFANERPQIMIYYWFYDKVDNNKNTLKRGSVKGHEQHFVDKIDMSNIRGWIDYLAGSRRFLKKVNDPKIADVIVKTSNGKEFYFCEYHYDPKYQRVPTNPSWTNSMPKLTPYMERENEDFLIRSMRG